MEKSKLELKGLEKKSCRNNNKGLIVLNYLYLNINCKFNIKA